MAHDIQAALLALLPRVQRTSSAHAHLVRRAQGHVQCDGNLLQLGMHEIVQSGVQFTPFKRAWHAHNALSQEMHRQIGKHTSRTTQRSPGSVRGLDDAGRIQELRYCADHSARQRPHEAADNRRGARSPTRQTQRQISTRIRVLQGCHGAKRDDEAPQTQTAHGAQLACQNARRPNS